MCSNGLGFDIVVVGSVTTYLQVYTPRLPQRGETVLGRAFRTLPGGQGANQAVCAARLGAKTAILCKVGDDSFGRDHVANFAKEKIDHRLVVVSRSAPTGVAHVLIDDDDNSISTKSTVISSGANARLGVQEVFGAAPSHLTGGKVLLVGLEIPPDVALYALKLASDHEMTTVLAPTCAVQDYKFDDELYSNCDWFIPNRRCVASLFSTQQQCQQLLQQQRQSQTLASASTSSPSAPPPICESVDDAKAMAKRLRDRGCKNVIITVGAEGVVFLSEYSKVAIHIAAPPIDQKSVVDASGAADAFAGSFAYFLAKIPPEKLRRDVEVVYDIISKSCAVATFSVQRSGTMSSFPSQADIKLSDLL